MDLNKYTKAELISQLKKQKQTSPTITEKSPTKSPNIIDVLLQFKVWIFSLTIISVLMKIFNNYKSIKAILKLANYIVWTIFGLSIFEAFGFTFLIKLFGELRYIFAAVVTYLTDTTFFNYVLSIFKVADDKVSVRSTYNKPIDNTDWKAEFEKAERQREMEKWKERYANHKDEKTDMKTIALLLLCGSIATWYYGPDILNIISPVWNMKDLIKKVIRIRIRIRIRIIITRKF